jgi:hypothetical protein
MDGTNHSRGSTIQSLSPDKREDLEHELRPEALASIAREETAEVSTNTCCFRGAAAAVAPESRASLLMLEDAAHMTIFSHPTRIAEAVDELWGGALRYEEEL